jgi:hypothetical protein
VLAHGGIRAHAHDSPGDAQGLRPPYGELLADERADTSTAFLERVLAWLGEHGARAGG